MRKTQGFLERLESDERQTLGALRIYRGTDEVFSCKTLELPWRQNRPFISRIPNGEYTVQRRSSKTYGEHWELLDVPDRTLILIHHGNFYRDTEGCICVGRDYYDIDRDGHRDVTSSRNTMQDLNYALAPVIRFQLKVI